MKKILLLIGCLLISINSANALTLNDDGSYQNRKGVNITAEQYQVLIERFNKGTIDLFDQKKVNYYSDSSNDVTQGVTYSITTDIMDKNGNIIDSRKISATEEEALAIAKNENLHVSSSGKLMEISNKTNILGGISTNAVGTNWEYATSSKKVRLTYSAFTDNYNPKDPSDDEYIAIIEAKWYTQPKIKQFDVLGIRWNNSIAKSNVLSGAGYQDTSNGYYQDYSLDDKNNKRNTYGIGQSMNLFNNGKDFELGMMYEFENSVGETMYGTYQHAKNSNANTLAISQSYSFSSSGLGGVLYYSNSTYRSYYDGMEGVVDTLSSGSHFEW